MLDSIWSISTVHKEVDIEEIWLLVWSTLTLYKAAFSAPFKSLIHRRHSAVKKQTNKRYQSKKWENVTANVKYV